MRIAHTTAIALLLAGAISSASSAQVLTPFQTPKADQRLDQAVPVASVSLIGEPIALADARPVQDPTGEPFVLGSAMLDMRDPAHAKFVFAMTNASDVPIPWEKIELDYVRAQWNPDNDRFFFGTGIYGAAGHHGTWQPGSTVTVQLPIPLDSPKMGPLQGLLVLVKSTDTPRWRARGYSTDSALLQRAFEKVVPHTQQ
jgi:hypothetical protein